MADKKISFSLNLTTDQAKAAIDDFQKQLNQAAQSFNSGTSEFNKIGMNVSDGFKRALQDIKYFQDKIKDEMKQGVGSIFQPGSRDSFSGKIADGLKDLIKAEYENVKTALAKTNEELSKARKDLEGYIQQTKGQALDTAAMRERTEKVVQLESRAQQETRTLQVVDAVRKSGETNAGAILAQLQGGGAGGPPAAPPGAAAGGAAGGGFNFGMAARIGGAITGGNLAPLFQESNILRMMGLAGGVPATVATVVSSSREALNALYNREAREAVAYRQYASGGSFEFDQNVIARQIAKDAALGEYGAAVRRDMRGNLGERLLATGEGFSSLLNRTKNIFGFGMDPDAFAAQLLEEKLQRAMPLTQGFAQAYSLAGRRSADMYNIERVMGTYEMNALLTDLGNVGIPAERARKGLGLATRYGGRVTAGLGGQMFLNLENRMGISDALYEQAARAGGALGAVGDVGRAVTGMFEMYGFGGAGAFDARGVLSDPMAQYVSQFGAREGIMEGAKFIQGAQAVQGATGLGFTESAKIGAQITAQRLATINNPESLQGQIVMGELAKLGITNRLEAAYAMSLGVGSRQFNEFVANYAKKRNPNVKLTAQDVASQVGQGLGKLGQAQGRMLGGSELFLETLKEQFPGRTITAEGVVSTGTLKNIDLVSGASAVTAESVAGLTPSMKEAIDVAGPGTGQGRKQTIRDTQAEAGAKVESALMENTGILRSMKEEGLKVIIDNASLTQIEGMLKGEEKRKEATTRQEELDRQARMSGAEKALETGKGLAKRYGASK